MRHPIVFTFGWAEPGHPIPPGSTTVEYTLVAEGDKTRVRLVHRGLPDDAVELHHQGWDHYLARLAVVGGGGDAGPDRGTNARSPPKQPPSREGACMEIDRYEHGVPSWVDLSTPDPAKAGEFYSALFGWTVQPGPPEAGGYAIAELRGRPVAGIGPQMNPGPPVWATYVNVDDADTVVKTATAAGGTPFMEPMDVLDVGRMAFFGGPQGAVIGVWQPKSHKGAGLVNEPGTLTWNELMTTDTDAAAVFYGEVFGWDAITHGEGAGAYTEFQVAGRSIAGMMAKPAEMPAEVPPYWGVYFSVANADETMQRVSELGGNVMMPPRAIEPGRFAMAVDPTGAMFSILEPNPA